MTNYTLSFHIKVVSVCSLSILLSRSGIYLYCFFCLDGEASHFLTPFCTFDGVRYLRPYFLHIPSLNVHCDLVLLTGFLLHKLVVYDHIFTTMVIDHEYSENLLICCPFGAIPQ